MLVPLDVAPRRGRPLRLDGLLAHERGAVRADQFPHPGRGCISADRLPGAPRLLAAGRFGIEVVQPESGDARQCHDDPAVRRRLVEWACVEEEPLVAYDLS